MALYTHDMQKVTASCDAPRLQRWKACTTIPCCCEQQQPTVVFVDFLLTAASNSESQGSQCAWQSVIGGQQQIWPEALLQQDFPAANVVVLSCPVDTAELRSSSKRGSKAAAALVQTMQTLWQHQNQNQHCCQPQQLVLVAHGFGGHLLKEVCLQLQSCTADPQLPASQRQQYACTLQSISAMVFFSTPHQPVPRVALPEYEYVLPDMARVCDKFRALCKQHDWQTLGVGAGVQQRPPRSCTIPLSAAAKGMSCFITVPADQEGVCRPHSRHHPSYVALQAFLKEHLAQVPGSAPDHLAAPTMAAATEVMTHLQAQGSPAPPRASLLARLVAC